MKLVKFIIIISLIFTIVFGVLSWKIASFEYYACYIPDANDNYSMIVKDLETEPFNKIEEKYNCKVILTTDDYYSNYVYEAIEKGNVTIDYLEGDVLLGKVILYDNSDSLFLLKKNLSLVLWIIFAVIMAVLYLGAYIIYVRILKPFKLLKHFANNISVGKLDMPLTMNKSNYFGAFTESFDMMREELKKAKEGEYRANISKKELVAGLSHDIKNPVATIKALCEVLDLRLKDDDLASKIHTIKQKADIIDKLISNMFHATLEELMVLKIEPREELSTIIGTILDDLNYYGKINEVNEIPSCLLFCDKLRLNQVIDNVISNSYKYANTKIDITFGDLEKYITIEIRDYGDAFLESNLPLVFGKYYRGDNAVTHSGSGLGLYLAKQFMVGMKGDLRCHLDNGFVVTLLIGKA